MLNHIPTPLLCCYLDEHRPIFAHFPVPTTLSLHLHWIRVSTSRADGATTASPTGLFRESRCVDQIGPDHRITNGTDGRFSKCSPHDAFRKFGHPFSFPGNLNGQHPANDLQSFD